MNVDTLPIDCRDVPCLLMSEDHPTVLVRPSPSFADLPNDVLFKIFSLLPLRSVLQLEYLCRRLHSTICAYLATVKCIDLHYPTTTIDIFRLHDPKVISKPILPHDLSGLLTRCPQATKISYIPVVGTTELYREKIDELVHVLTRHRRIRQIGFCDSLNLLSSVRKLQPYLDIGIDEVYVGSTDLEYAPPCLSSLCVSCRPRLSLGRNLLDYADFNLLSKFTELEITDCCLNSTSHFGRSSLTFSRIEFANLKSFTYSEITRYSYSPAFTALASTVAQSPALASLKLAITNFSVLVDIANNWRSENLRNLELTSAGSYSASLEHISLAPVVANLITVCADTLETVTLSSSLLVKQFFTNVVSNVTCFPKLQTFSMTGIADTKMFLAPGNMVETRYYQNFISLCPDMKMISLHSFSGSLASLSLPLGLREVTLPWDNRLNLTQHRDAVLATLNVLPGLEKLTIAGVEEVDSLLQESSSLMLRGPPTLAIESETLLEVRISNICIRKLDLRGCTRLTKFVLHYCPVLQTLLLPVKSLEQVHIYDSYHPYLPKFLESFVLQKERALSCHLRIQVHSMRKKEPEMASQAPNETKYKELIADVTSACSAASKIVDYVFLCDEEIKLFQHNSGEPLFPFTEFQSFIPSCARSAEDIRLELNRRNSVLEGVRRWQDYLLTAKSRGDCVIATGDAVVPGSIRGDHATSFKAVYCSSRFDCRTNIPFFMNINQSPVLCQPSTSASYKVDSRGETSEDERQSLNVPRLRWTDAAKLSASSSHCRPTLFISTVAYAHDIHTLFYYA